MYTGTSESDILILLGSLRLYKSQLNFMQHIYKFK